MIYSQIEVPTHDCSPNGDGKSTRFEPSSPWRAPAYAAHFNVPAALIVSSDEDVLQELAEIIVQCGIGAFVAFSIHEGKRILERHRVSIVVCDDRLSDGKYEDILNEIVQLHLRTPVIVVSPTGDWSDYLKAITAGAFDYLAYPPIPGDLPRIVCEALTPPMESNFQDRTGKSFYLL